MHGKLTLVATLMLGGCATQPAPVTQQRTIICKAGKDCEAKWSRAISWMATSAPYRIQTQTDSLIQTAGPLRNDASPAFVVTKLALPGGTFQITFDGGCDNLFGCVPSVAEARESFASTVYAGEF